MNGGTAVPGFCGNAAAKVEFKVGHEIMVDPLDEWNFKLDCDKALDGKDWNGKMLFSYNDMVDYIIKDKVGYFETHVSRYSTDSFRWTEYEVDYEKCSEPIEYSLKNILNK